MFQILLNNRQNKLVGIKCHLKAIDAFTNCLNVILYVSSQATKNKVLGMNITGINTNKIVVSEIPH